MELTPAQKDFIKSSITDIKLSEWNVELAGQAASQRRFVRISKKEESFILVEWDSRDEDWPRFLTIQNEISHLVPFLPEIYANDPRHGLILEEDLGTLTLKQFCLENAGNSSLVEQMYRNVIDALFEWQMVNPQASTIISSRAMDLDIFLWESAYFARHCATEFFGKENFLTSEWEEERHRMARLASELKRTCMHRDFQSENVLIHKEKVRFVDYQGARLGPPQYDAASLLYDPYIPFLDLKSSSDLLDYFIAKWGGNIDQHSFFICSAQRLMQALGAYGNLTLHKGKPRYREFIPTALTRLSSVFEHLPDFPVMRNVVEKCRESLEEMVNAN